jgi:hypothetical protein
MEPKTKTGNDEPTRPILRAIPKGPVEDEYVPTWDDSRRVSISDLNATLLGLLVRTVKFPFVWLPSFMGSLFNDWSRRTSGSKDVNRTLLSVLGLVGLVALLASVTVLPLLVSIFFSQLVGGVVGYLPAGFLDWVGSHQGGIRGALFLWSILAICGTLFSVYSAGGWSRLLANNELSRREI